MITVVRVDGAAAYDLIYPDHFAKLSNIWQDGMKRAMRNSSHVWIGLEGPNRIVAAFGLIAATTLSDSAYLWLFTTEHMTPCYAFVRQSKRLIAEMLELYPTIVGHGSVGAERSLRWLRWLGAEFGEPQGPFLPFTIKASQQWPQDLAQSA